jgi:hypothetical protein
VGGAGCATWGSVADVGLACRAGRPSRRSAGSNMGIARAGLASRRGCAFMGCAATAIGAASSARAFAAHRRTATRAGSFLGGACRASSLMGRARPGRVGGTG